MTRSRKTLIVSVAATLTLLAGGARPAPAQGFDPAVLRGADAPPNALWLEQLDFSAMTSGWGTPLAGKTVQENPLLLGRVLYPRGIGTHSASEWTTDLHGEAVRFLSYVGVLDEVACGESAAASIRYVVKADGRIVADSGVMKWGDPPKLLDADLAGAAKLTLVVDPVERIHFDHAAWAGALLFLAPEAPTAPGRGAAARGREAAGEHGRRRPAVEGRGGGPAAQRSGAAPGHPLARRPRGRRPGARLDARGHREDTLHPRRDHLDARGPRPRRAGAGSGPRRPGAPLHVVRRHPGRRFVRGGRPGARLGPLPGLRGRSQEGRQRRDRLRERARPPRGRPRRRKEAAARRPGRHGARPRGRRLGRGPDRHGPGGDLRARRPRGRPRAARPDGLGHRPPAGHPPPARRRHDARPTVPVPHPGDGRRPAGLLGLGPSRRRHPRPEDRHPGRLGEGAGHHGRGARRLLSEGPRDGDAPDRGRDARPRPDPAARLELLERLGTRGGRGQGEGSGGRDGREAASPRAASPTSTSTTAGRRAGTRTARSSRTRSSRT